MITTWILVRLTAKARALAHQQSVRTHLDDESPRGATAVAQAPTHMITIATHLQRGYRPIPKYRSSVVFSDFFEVCADDAWQRLECTLEAEEEELRG